LPATSRSLIALIVRGRRYRRPRSRGSTRRLRRCARRYHTHSKPTKNARIVYIGRFDLPPSHQVPDRHAPCPCCSPRAPKYSREGKIAWFPDEHVVRMIGPDCFHTLNPEGHWEAVEVFKPAVVLPTRGPEAEMKLCRTPKL
jgi:hypothetical protein